MHDDVGTRRVQASYDRRADAPRAAGDQDDVAAQRVRFDRFSFQRSLHAGERYRNGRAA